MSRAEELLKQINKRIESLDVGDTPGNLYDPIYYIMKLGGKRLRPLLTLLSYELFSGSVPEEMIDPALKLGNAVLASAGRDEGF